MQISLYLLHYFKMYIRQIVVSRSLAFVKLTDLSKLLYQNFCILPQVNTFHLEIVRKPDHYGNN